MSKSSFQLGRADEKIGLRWAVVPLAFVLGAVTVALLWPADQAMSPSAAVDAKALWTAPQPQPAALQATPDDGAPARPTVDTSESQEDNHAPTF